MAAMVEVKQPFKGRWNCIAFGSLIGSVIGDAVIGFSARDADGHVLGQSKFDTAEEAINCVLMSEA